MNTQNPSQEVEGEEKVKNRNKRKTILTFFFSPQSTCTWTCRLTAQPLGRGGGGRGGPYLEGLEEAPSSSAGGPVLHLVVVPTQAHHGLAVDVQLLVQGLQQGRTCALLNVGDT